MDNIETNLALAVYEYNYTFERKKYNDLLTQKAIRLKSLESKDLMVIPDVEALKIVRQIEYLHNELNTLYGFKLFSDQLEKGYLDSTERIFNAYKYANLFLENELKQSIERNSYFEVLFNKALDCISHISNNFHLTAKEKR